MLAQLTHILPLTTIRRERLLPAPGRVLVHTGQKVLATDAIAVAKPANRHMLLEVARGLGVPPEEANPLIQLKEGQKVTKGDIIAGPIGMLSRTVRAPSDGIVVAVGEGEVLLELEGESESLLAGMPGTVVDLVTDRGAVIETSGALVQGMWGNNQMDKSLLSVLTHSPDDELVSSQLDVSQRGSVVLGSYCGKEETLKTAIELPLRGLILASMPARLVPLARQAPFPIMLLEGFGRLPMNPVAYTILTTNEEREVTVNASAWDPQRGIRPEAIIQLPTTSQIPAPAETDIFALGQTVRIRRAPCTAQAGTLVSLRSGQTVFPSGIHAQAGVVKLENGEQVVVPLANLDVLE